MQPTRQLILNHLKEHGQATVEDLAEVLHLTSVTVRHHLDILRGEGIVAEPAVRRSTSPGRPQYVFTLTEKSSAHFPKNYNALAANVLAELKATAPRTVNVIFEGIANRFAADAPRPAATDPLPKRLDQAIAFLNTQGYVAHWESADEGYVVYTHNCPYAGLPDNHPELCGMDSTLISRLLGAPVECAGRLTEGAHHCAYRIVAQ
jgi:predicted ArsR family transcriptional regulator